MFKRCLMVSLLSLTFAQTIVWSLHVAPRELLASAEGAFSLPDAFDAVHAQWKYYKVSRPVRDPRDRAMDLDTAL